MIYQIMSDDELSMDDFGGGCQESSPVPSKPTMTADEYQTAAMRTANFGAYKDNLTAMNNAALGLCGESGEVADIVKKALFQGHFFHDEKEHLVKELGDIAWYLALGATALDVPLSEIFEKNIEKLRKRYPNGFDSERSQHRADGDI